MCISLAQSATLSQIARVGEIIDQTDGEEFASMLKDRRSVNEVSEVSVDLDRAIQSQAYRTELNTIQVQLIPLSF